MDLQLPLRLYPAGFKRVLRERRSSNDPLFRSGVWRYAELLPQFDRSAIVTLSEGNMPLYESTRGAAYVGVDALAYLHLGMNPTGSFKDLGMTVAVSAAKAEGARGVICASTGNTASSMAAYAARAGMEAHALVPRGRVSAAKLAQMRDYGVQLTEIEGSFDDAFQTVLRSFETRPTGAPQDDKIMGAPQDDNTYAGLVVVNSSNPFRIEGQKCSAFAILESRDWVVPDWIVVPGGNLGNSSAIGKGFREALALGLIDRLPRLAIVRSEDPANTVASAIAIVNPWSLDKAQGELEASKGVMITIDDDAILEAKFRIGAEGIGCEPASAASLAGARLLREQRVIQPSDDIVCVLTGHVLKDIDSIVKHRDAYEKRLQHAAF